MTTSKEELSMPTKAGPDFRAGDLRSTLIANKARWTVSEHLDDADMIPRYPTGSTTEGLIPSDKVARIEFEKVLAVPPSNPWLMARRVVLGILPREGLSEDLIRHLPESTDTAPEDEITPLAGPTPPQQVDWENRWGWPWITTVREQTPCGACWAFAATALVESMVRVEHAVWCWRSEGDVHKGIGAHCEDAGNSWAALNWIAEHGIADPDCFPWRTDDVVNPPTMDRSGRVVQCPQPMQVGSIDDQKKWLDAVGPLVTYFEVWHDFRALGDGVYHKQATVDDEPNWLAGGHFMLVVGYDDNQGCWKVKNSWGTKWGQAGYGLIAYGECEIDTYAKIGLQGTDPDPWTKRRLHNGNLLESGKGAKYRNFEMLATGSRKIHQWWRDNAETGKWSLDPELFADDAASYPTLISSTFNRSFECVFLTTTGRLHHWWYCQTFGHWNDGGVFGPHDAAGIPGFIQSSYGVPGHLELVVRTADGRLNHWWRENAPSCRWHDGGRFAGNVAHSGPSLIQSHFGRTGNFELVCVLDTGQMQHWWRANDHGGEWRQAKSFGENVDSTPCMVEASHAADDETQVGNFELCVAVDGRVQHWWRHNHGDGAWRNSATFGHDVQQVVGLLQGSYGFHLEVVVLRTDGALQHYWRDSAGWHEGVMIGTVPTPPSVTPASYDFGEVRCPGPGREKTFQLRNTGTWVIRVDNIQVSGDGFALSSSSCGRAPTLEPGTTCSLDVRFRPRLEGRYEGEITVHSRDPQELTISVPLKGIGVSNPNL